MKFQTSRIASAAIADMASDKIDSVLLAVADALTARAPELLEANAADCMAMDSTDPRYDRLKLTPERIADIAERHTLRSRTALSLRRDSRLHKNAPTDSSSARYQFPSE